MKVKSWTLGATAWATGAAGTINRVIDAFPTNQQEQVRVQLSVTLICILSQALLARVDKPGRVAAKPALPARGQAQLPRYRQVRAYRTQA